MAELGGPRPIEAIEREHPKRVIADPADGIWLKIVTDVGDEAGQIGVWRSRARRRGGLGGGLDAARGVSRPRPGQRGAHGDSWSESAPGAPTTSCMRSRASTTHARTAAAAGSGSSSSATSTRNFAAHASVQPLAAGAHIGKVGDPVLAGLVGDQARLPPTRARRGAASAGRGSSPPSSAGDPEADLDAEQALAAPVDVVEVEQQRRLVEGQPDPGAEREGERRLEALAGRDQRRRRRPRTRSGSRARSGGCGGRRPRRCRTATSRCGSPRREPHQRERRR